MWIKRINWGAITENPMVWYIISALTIGLGLWAFKGAEPKSKYTDAIATLFISLGTSGILRVRTPRIPSPETRPSTEVRTDNQ